MVKCSLEERLWRFLLLLFIIPWLQTRVDMLKPRLQIVFWHSAPPALAWFNFLEKLRHHMEHLISVVLVSKHLAAFKWLTVWIVVWQWLKSCKVLLGWLLRYPVSNVWRSVVFSLSKFSDDRSLVRDFVVHEFILKYFTNRFLTFF